MNQMVMNLLQQLAARGQANEALGSIGAVLGRQPGAPQIGGIRPANTGAPVMPALTPQQQLATGGLTIRDALAGAVGGASAPQFLKNLPSHPTKKGPMIA